MSERMTSVDLRGGGAPELSYADRGRKTRAEMITKIKADAVRIREQCNRVLEADDDDFIVETYIGIFVMRNREEVRQ